MRPSSLAIAIVAATAAAGGSAQAQNYPWCAYYGDGFGGTNCGFSTLQQCQEDVSGIGGYCEPNTLYVPPQSGRKRRRQPSS